MSQQFSIIYSCLGFCIVDKPPNIAMDGGDGAVTVQSWGESAETKQLLASRGVIPAQSADENNNNDGDESENNAAAQHQQQQQQQRKGSHVDPNVVDGRVRFCHQLDYATSGLLALAFSKRIAQKVTFSFEARQTRKEYLAVVHGWVRQDEVATLNSEPDVHNSSSCDLSDLSDLLLLPGDAAAKPIARGVINLPIGRDPTDERGFRMTSNRRRNRENEGEDEQEQQQQQQQQRAATAAEGDFKSAATIVTVLRHGYFRHQQRGAGEVGSDTHVQETEDENSTRIPVSFVHLQLLTGRRHQLRVHCAASGFPILGDATYAAETERAISCWPAGARPPRMLLHAWRLSLPQSAVTAAGANSADEVDQARARKAQIKQVRRRQQAGGDGAAAAAADAGGSGSLDGDQEPRLSFMASNPLMNFIEFC